MAPTFIYLSEEDLLRSLWQKYLLQPKPTDKTDDGDDGDDDGDGDDDDDDLFDLDDGEVDIKLDNTLLNTEMGKEQSSTASSSVASHMKRGRSPLPAGLSSSRSIRSKTSTVAPVKSNKISEVKSVSRPKPEIKSTKVPTPLWLALVWGSFDTKTGFSSKHTVREKSLIKMYYNSVKCPQPNCNQFLESDKKRPKFCRQYQAYFDRDTVGSDNTA
ncbi:hypothetical protein FBU30_002579 [Linnemannia zychae]|nr:hypothetical protein FBU30_002579 [Linnemannia zychae]